MKFEPIKPCTYRRSISYRPDARESLFEVWPRAATMSSGQRQAGLEEAGREQAGLEEEAGLEEAGLQEAGLEERNGLPRGGWPPRGWPPRPKREHAAEIFHEARI